MSCGTFTVVVGGSFLLTFDCPIEDSSSSIPSYSIDLGSVGWWCNSKCVEKSCITWSTKCENWWGCKNKCKAWGVKFCCNYGPKDCKTECTDKQCIWRAYDWCKEDLGSVTIWPEIVFGMNNDVILDVVFLATDSYNAMTQAITSSTSIKFLFKSGTIYVKIAGSTIASFDAADLPAVIISDTGTITLEFDAWEFNYTWEGITEKFSLIVGVVLCPLDQTIALSLSAKISTTYNGVGYATSVKMQFPVYKFV